ncbi:MAG TPA: rhodanese-like domain-containing protein [Anaerolineae bacterium]|jgi:rhodanese-related sulfurtransferase|nr:rhodanese-like domain-containing protein [Anaerolineae bacterium]
MKTRWLLLLLLVLILAACGGTDTAAPAAEQSADLASLDLAPEVDVHTVAEVKDRDDVYVLDVREQWEYDEGHIPGVTLLPIGEVPARLDEIPTDKEVIVTCRSGNRSSQVTDYLRQNGFDNVHNMQGGILAWEQAGYEVSR